MKTPSAGAVRKPTDEAQSQLDSLNPPVYPDMPKFKKEAARPGKYAQTSIRAGKNL
jgi:hypothetical protein